jgi:hypothetical protein
MYPCYVLLIMRGRIALHDFFDYGSKRMCKNPRVLTYDWIKTGGSSREGVGAAVLMMART